MASLGNPRSWVPYMNNKDCSQGFCSLYCPQWCYIVYPPPPPFEVPEDNSSPNFSPLVIAVIGILVSALLLVSYYTIISRYCGNNPESSSDGQNHPHPLNRELEQFHQPSGHVSPNGLDEALIKSITVCRYKKEDGLVAVADCSVCLSEFKEDDTIRLLPKCSHAFHIPCIDTWLKSHSSCPLCRAGIFIFNDSSLQESDSSMENSTSQGNRPGNENDEVVGSAEPEESEEARQLGTAPKPTLRAMSDLGHLQGRHRVIEIKDEGYVEPFRRSVSMDHSFQSGNRVAVEEEGCVNEAAGPSKRWGGESSKSNSRRRVLQCVLSPIVMKRSFSSGRFSISRGRQGIIPI